MSLHEQEYKECESEIREKEQPETHEHKPELGARVQDHEDAQGIDNQTREHEHELESQTQEHVPDQTIEPQEHELEHAQLLQWAEALEAPFALNDYNGSVMGDIVFAYQSGSCPILISCPHTVNHRRGDWVKEMDEYTGALGLILKSLTDCHLMFTTKLYDEDPNFVEGGVYKSELVRLSKKHGIRFVIDLHGASSTREFDIDLGSRYGKTLREPAANIITEQLRKHGLSDVRSNDTFAATSPGTVTAHTARHLKIQAVQIEINGKYRSPRTDIESFFRIVKGLTQAIECIKEDVRQNERQKQRIIRSERCASAGHRRRNIHFRARW
ncbi:N-formylglutamate amidohydrolase [Paenibacillus radicis (ex Xue et al. 2023)]|uniref:N-formylglutamate amidohydrolase n=1 Tax=Paenibacillus radicis (ex Xue et al. 2023) TaxID=2972489 RepID=A0ABT1YR62_9BACL|nr:N-formylglutamate amidohydrolase [Paenibacillus radicis (ex Xue et al. 2023)]MCR8635662.1 N-formylglutamate amidohydrolase [Paenibacillus radicis (ex Xue et al. 2023)]